MITEAQMTHSEMVKAAGDGHICGKCGGTLTVAWGGAFGVNSYVLRCHNSIEHDTITRHDKNRESEIREIKEVRNLDSKALQTMSEAQMVERVNMARFPQDLTVPERKLLAQVAITYGFDPLMGEVSIYQGRPFVSIDGRYRAAQETNELDGVESRPATEQERADWQIPEGDYFFRAEVYKKGSSRPFIGWGRVHGSETKPGSRKPGDTTSTFKPVQSNPQRMAEKRAEAQALRKAFHIPLPSIEDIGSPDYDVDSTAVEVDKTTGEITEAKVKRQADPIGNAARERIKKSPEPEPEEQQQPPQEPTGAVLHPEKEETSTSGAGKMPKPDRDPESVKTIDELFKACHSDFGMQPAQVLKELGYKSRSDISESPASCFETIVALRCE